MTTHDEVMHDPLIAEHCGLLAEAAGRWPTRRCGTAARSAARWPTRTRPATCPPSSLALDATMIAHGPGGERAIGASDFFDDYLTTALAADEILTGVRVPKLGPGWGYRYEKFHRTAQAWAIVGVAALARRSNGQVAEARIGLTNMGSVPVRARAVEAAVAGAEATRDALRRPRSTRPTGRTRRQTCTARPTTGATWRGY